MNTLTTTNLDSMSTGQAAVAGGFLGTILTIGIILAVLLLIAGWRIFEKAGERGWKILIPFYDIYILFKICGLKKWFWCYFCLTIISTIMIMADTPKELTNSTNYDLSLVKINEHIPFLIGNIVSVAVSIFATIAVSIKLARAFGKGVGYALGLFFLPSIFTLILGFGKAKYSKKAVDA